MSAGDSFNPLPLMKLWGTLLVPLQGEVTDDLAERIHTEVLDYVHRADVENIIIDITGLWLLDSHICAMLAALGNSAKLMGARTVICGMSAEIAQTLQMMDIGLDSVESSLNVEEAFELVGLYMTRQKPSSEAGDDPDAAPMRSEPDRKKFVAVATEEG
jgi:rsbT antagonist protein RsbS